MVRAGVGVIWVAALGSAPALAESPLALSSRVETGWTSNATDSGMGGEDIYATHSHDLTLTARTDNLVLRGSLALAQTRFASTHYENDDEVTGAIEAQLVLGSSGVLRLGYAVTRRWTGDGLAIGSTLVPVRSASTDHEYLAEFALRGTDQQVTVAVTGVWEMPGDSVLEGLGLPPLRLSPQVASINGRLGWERALSENMAVLGGMETWFTSIPDEDQVVHLRAPADGGRVAAGLRMIEGNWSAEAWGGIDMVWPKGFSEMTRSLPYVSVAASLVPMVGVTLSASAKTGVELADPVDGVAGRTAAIELGATWTLTPQVTVSATLAGQQEQGLFEESLQRSVRMAKLGASYALSQRVALGTTLSWARHDDPRESYDKAGLALSMNASF
jgi:hypothetical protein